MSSSPRDFAPVPAERMDSRLPLQGRVAVITGAGRGIGRAVALKLRDCGASVCGFDIAFEHDEESDLTYMQVTADVSDPAMIEQGLAAVDEQLGPPDVLVNNAAVTSHTVFLDLSLEEWNRIIAINLTGTFLMCRAVAPSMVRRGRGRIINIGSDLGLVGGMRVAHYAASKGGVTAFSKSLARELASSGITVNVVAPGPIATEMLTAYPDEYNESTLATIPLGRWGTPSDVAETVAFVASDQAAFYTGWIFSPNGGVIM